MPPAGGRYCPLEPPYQTGAVFEWGSTELGLWPQGSRRAGRPPIVMLGTSRILPHQTVGGYSTRQLEDTSPLHSWRILPLYTVLGYYTTTLHTTHYTTLHYTVQGYYPDTQLEDTTLLHSLRIHPNYISIVHHYTVGVDILSQYTFGGYFKHVLRSERQAH